MNRLHNCHYGRCFARKRETLLKETIEQFVIPYPVSSTGQVLMRNHVTVRN